MIHSDKLIHAMKPRTSSLELLIESFLNYGKSAIELYKFKAIDRISRMISSVMVKIFFAVYFILVFVFLNIGIAFLIGDYFQSVAIGFFITGASYALIGVMLYFLRDACLRKPMTNSIVSNMLK
jgi:hypothetical protein